MRSFGVLVTIINLWLCISVTATTYLKEAGRIFMRSTDVVTPIFLCGKASAMFIKWRYWLWLMVDRGRHELLKRGALSKVKAFLVGGKLLTERRIEFAGQFQLAFQDFSRHKRQKFSVLLVTELRLQGSAVHDFSVLKLLLLVETDSRLARWKLKLKLG